MRRTLKWTGIVIVALFVLSLVLPDASEEEAVSAECMNAMRTAASVSDMQDTVSDLYPALEACGTVEAFTAASEEHPDALDGVDPETFARNACRSAPQAARDAPLCISLAD
jgi:hypothetical protein